MNEFQIKALFEMIQYNTRMVFEVRKAIRDIRDNNGDMIRRLRERNAKLLAEKIQLKQQLDEIEKFSDQ